MSILQEYEQIRKQIGYEKYDMIEQYLNEVSPQENQNKYDEELKLLKDLPFEEWLVQENKLKDKYNILLLSDILYKKSEWVKFETWYYENCKKEKVEVLSTWATDYDDIRCNAILYKDGLAVADVVGSYDETDVRYSIGEMDSLLDDEFVKEACQTLIYDDFDEFLKLPSLAKCSKLLQEIYDSVRESDSAMCHIFDDEWEKYYSDRFSDKDIKKLEEEIKKYNLENIIEIYDKGCQFRIIGYGDLETLFNDDRKIYNIKSMDTFTSGRYSGYNMIFTGRLSNGYYYSHSDLTDSVKIYDKKPYSNDYYKNRYKWEQTHLLEELNCIEAKDLFKIMDNLVDKVITNLDDREIAHNHLKGIIESKEKELM